MGKIFVLSQKGLKLFSRTIAIVLLALVYYGTAELSRHVASTPQSVTPVWPPDGFAAAAVLIFGSQILPGVLIGSFLANIWAFFNAENLYVAIASILQVLGIAIGTTIGIGLGCYLLRVSIKRKNPLIRLNDVYKFLFFTGVLAPIVNATTGVLCLYLGGKVTWSLFNSVWLTWWISNVAGISIFTPAILTWHDFYLKYIKNRFYSSTTEKREQTQINRWKFIEAIVLFLLVISISLVSFYQSFDLEYMLIPCLVWAVLRFGQFGATNLIVVITMIAVSGTVKGLGAFSVQNPNYSLISLQSFIVVIVVTTLSLIAILAEKQEAIANLQKSKIKLIDKSLKLEKSQASLNETTLILEQQNVTLIEAKKFAEDANRSKTEFLSNMSHELRTPLNAILGFAQLLQDSSNLDDQDKSDIHAIHQSGMHLLNLINDILDISKIEAGKMEIYLQDVYMPVFLNDLVEIIQVQSAQKNIDFICDFADDLPEVVYADGKRLKQILLNLLSNAIKFTTKGNVIFRVKSNKKDKFDKSTQNSFVSIFFEVEDSGIGIESDKFESIFTPFEQVEETKFKFQGTGLGLAISQKIASMMGSKITVSSQSNVGSIFRINVNLEEVIEDKSLIKNNVLVDRNKSPLELQLAQQLPLNILLAEDNIVNQIVARKILNRLGYEIEIVSTGLKVLAAMNERVYDVIFMDVQMPEMNGIETTQHIIKAKGLTHRPYIIAMTANAMDGDREICIDAGMDDYISKPINVDLLVQSLLRSHRAKQNA